MATTADSALYERLNPLLGPLHLPYVPHEPTAKQEFFLLQSALEVFFGGAAGPGKSWGLLMGGLQFVDHPGYHALLLRPALTEFEQPGGLIEVAEDWLGGIRTADAPHWDGSERSWKFPSRATLRFGYLANIGDLSRYKGPSYSYVGFDELTSFTERLYRSMFRVLRQAKDRLEGIPVRMRAASNPGDLGHAWVKGRFIEQRTREKGAVYIPAKMKDNPYLDVEQYLKSLAHMHPVDRQRLIDGDWDVAEEGSKFKRTSFKIISAGEQRPSVKKLRYWDLAGTAPSQSNASPDYTVGLRYEVDAQGFYTITDVVRGQWSDDEVENLVRQTAQEDGREVTQYIEQDPGQAGKAQISNYQRRVLRGFACYKGSTRINGFNAAKEVRCRPAGAAVGNGLVRILDTCRNLREFLDEVCLFPNDAHDDTVDAFSGAHNHIQNAPGRAVRTAVPRSTIPGVTRTR